MTTPNQSSTLAVYMKRPEVITKFTDIMGEIGKSYVQSVLIAVSASPDLMKCTNESIFRSALRAASLGLSCDPALKQAWLVPYNRKVKTANGDQWIKEAQFQPHYKGLYTLAMRTGKYWQINVAPIYDGQRVMENPLTGLHAVLESGSNTPGIPNSYNAAYSMDVTVRRARDRKIIGWIGYFKTKKGFEKSVYMSVMEIDDHARKYVKDYDKNPNWNDADKRPVMEMKTVLRQLLSWADLSGNENNQLIEALQADESIEGQAEDIPAPATVTPISLTYEQAQAMRTETPWGNLEIGKLDREKLNSLYWDDMTDDDARAAIRIVLKEEYSVEPPEKPRPTKEQSLKDIGF